MTKSKLDLVLEKRFNFINKGDDVYFVSKEFLNKTKRNKIVLGIRDVISDGQDEIYIICSLVDSLAYQEPMEIGFMLGEIPLDDVMVEDVISDKEKFESDMIFIDLHENGYMKKFQEITIEDKNILNATNNCDFWYNSDIVINKIISLLNSIYGEDVLKMEGNQNKKNKYIITVLEEFCLDGQIIEDSCLNFSNTEECDKRDFFGNFMLGIEEAYSMEEAIKLASDRYEMRKEMLEVFKLA